MIPVSIGNDTHAAPADAAHRHGHAHGGKAHGAHGGHGKNGSPFASSLQGALADDDAAARLDGQAKDDDAKKLAPPAAGPAIAPAPQALAAALAMASMAGTAATAEKPADPAGEAAAKVGGQSRAKAVVGLEPPMDGKGARPADAPEKALATTAALDQATAAQIPIDPALLVPAMPTGATSASTPMSAVAGEPAEAAKIAPAAITSAPATAVAIATVMAAAPSAATASVAPGTRPETRDAKPMSSRNEADKTDEAERTDAPKAGPAKEAASLSPAKVGEAAPMRPQNEANEPRGDANDPRDASADRTDPGRPRGSVEKPIMTAKADKKIRPQADDVSTDAARVSASVAEPSYKLSPVAAADTAKTVTDAAPGGGDVAQKAETTVRGLSEVSAKTDDAIRAAEAAGHKRTLASGEASGQLVTPELGRIEVVAHAGLAHEAGRVEVHVRAVEEHAKQVIAANAESLREHVRVEVPEAVVHVQKPSNDLLGGGTTARDFSERSANGDAENTARDGRDGRGDRTGGRGDTVKNPALSRRGARVRFVL